MEKEFTAVWLTSHMVWLIKSSTAQTDEITVWCFVFQGAALIDVDKTMSERNHTNKVKGRRSRWLSGCRCNRCISSNPDPYIEHIHISQISLLGFSSFPCFYGVFNLSSLSVGLVGVFLFMLFLDSEPALILLLLLGRIRDLRPAWETGPKADWDALWAGSINVQTRKKTRDKMCETITQFLCLRHRSTYHSQHWSVHQFSIEHLEKGRISNSPYPSAWLSCESKHSVTLKCFASVDVKMMTNYSKRWHIPLLIPRVSKSASVI